MAGIATIGWTDATGAATLTNGKPNPASRFRGWIPNPRSINDAVEGLGSGTVHVWEFRDDYEAEFRLELIPYTDQDKVERLRRHMRGYGLISITTDDAASRTYPTCVMPVGADLGVEFDPEFREYTLTFLVRNVAASPAPLLCMYP